MPTKIFLLIIIGGTILSAILGDRLNEESIRVMQCFDDFIPLLNGAILEFSHNYQECFELDGYHYRSEPKQRNQDIEVVEEVRAFSVGRCQNATKRAFVENTATNYKGLHMCLEETQGETTTVAGVPSTTDQDDESVTPTPTKPISSTVSSDTSTIQTDVTTAMGRSSRMHISLFLVLLTLLSLN